MNRALCIAGLLIAAPVAADESTFPNKPGKKPEARIVIGVQSGATTAPPPRYCRRRRIWRCKDRHGRLWSYRPHALATLYAKTLCRL